MKCEKEDPKWKELGQNDFGNFYLNFKFLTVLPSGIYLSPFLLVQFYCTLPVTFPSLFFSPVIWMATNDYLKKVSNSISQ